MLFQTYSTPDVVLNDLALTCATPRYSLSLSLSLCVCVCVMWWLRLRLNFDSYTIRPPFRLQLKLHSKTGVEMNVPTFRCRSSDGCIAYVYCRGDVSSTRVSSSFTDSLHRLHCLRSCAMWVAVCWSTFISSQSSRIVSIHRFFRLPSASHSMNISIHSYMGKPVVAHSYHMPKKFQTPLLTWTAVESKLNTTLCPEKSETLLRFCNNMWESFNKLNIFLHTHTATSISNDVLEFLENNSYLQTQKSNCKQNHPKIRLHSAAAVVKVRGTRGLSPLLRFEPPAIVWAPDWIYKVLLYAQITPN